MNAREPKVTFEHLIAKVNKAEDALERHERRVGEASRRMGQAWRSGWTPARIISAGLVTGFLVGRTEPLGAVGGARWMQLISTVAGLFSSASAAVAASKAGEAEEAADEAADVATAAAGTVASEPPLGPTQRVRSARPHTGEWSSEPRPAEAATEVSER